MKWRALGHEQRVLLETLIWPLPTMLIALALLWFDEHHANDVKWTLTGFMLAMWIAGSALVKRRVIRALHTVSNLLADLKGGCFSARARLRKSDDALDQALSEINSLATTLESQRTEALEASALLSKVMSRIDIAIFAFDTARTLQLVNSAGERLLGQSASRLIGESAASLALEGFLEGDAPRTTEVNFSGGQGQWEVQRAAFRLRGLPHELLVLTDVRRALREEERLAWRRLVRVLGHEINNSLAPIRSIARDLQETLRRTDGPDTSEWREDLVRGLAVIERRSDALGRFMLSYGRLAALPSPRYESVDVGSCIRRVIQLEKRVSVRIQDGPSLTIPGDVDQLEQMLINLIQNAVDAAQETGGGVDVTWRMLQRQVEITITDEGPGVSNTQNLFVPFFTTKPNGSGIGLALSRQIAEAHAGTLTLEPRADRAGAVARVRLRRT